MSARRNLTILVGAVVAIAACSTSSTRSSSTTGQASQTIGPSGGTVTAADGTKIVIPPGALASDVTITIALDPSAPPLTQAKPLATVHAFGPEGQQFLKPVQVTLGFENLPSGMPESAIVVYTAPHGSSDYVPLPTSVADASHVTAQTTHFSGGVPGLPLGGATAAFVGTWSCQETTTLTNTCTGSCTSNDGGPQTSVQPAVWTITAGANGQIAIAADSLPVDGGISCDYNATISGSTATLVAGQTCITPPITGSDGHTETYTDTLSSGSVTVSGNTMTFTITTSVVGNSSPPGPTVGGTSTGTCTIVDAGSSATATDGAIALPDAGAGEAGAGGAFVGTWACTVTVTDAESDGGSSVTAETLTITAGAASGEIDESSFLPDGGLICTTTAATSGNMATFTPNQSCIVNGQTIVFQNETATVSGNTLTASSQFLNGTVSQSASENCTRE